METSSFEVIPLLVFFKYLKFLSVIILLFLSISLCCENDLGCELLLSDNASPMSYSRDGDIIIAGILQILLAHDHNILAFLERPSTDFCVLTSFKYLRHFLAFIYAIEEINNDTEILPNITLGFQIYDSCTSENLAVKSTLSIFSESQEPVPNYVCKKSQKTVAIIGHLLPSSTYTIARLTQLHGYPQISYGALSSFFGNSENFPLLHQTVPSELSQFLVIIKLLIHFEWTWVGIITTDDNHNQQATMELKKQMGKHHICVEFLAVISKDPLYHKQSGLRAVQIIKKSSVKVIILYCAESVFVGILEGWPDEFTGKVWITTTGIDHFLNYDLPNFNKKMNCSLEITFQKGNVPGFKNFLYWSTYFNLPDNIFIKYFWHFGLHCFDGYGKWNPRKGCVDGVLWKNLVSGDGTIIYRYSYTLFIAVHFISEALHHMNLEKQLHKPSSTNMLAKLKFKVSDIFLQTYTKERKQKKN